MYVIKSFEIFILTELYNGKLKETYVETRLQLYNKQKRKNLISLPPDPLKRKQAIHRANYQSYYGLHCTDKIFPQLLILLNNSTFNNYF